MSTSKDRALQRPPIKCRDRCEARGLCFPSGKCNILLESLWLHLKENKHSPLRGLEMTGSDEWRVGAEGGRGGEGEVG